MRKRIFSPHQLGLAAGAILKRDFEFFGGGDYTWHQEIEAGWGYTFASHGLYQDAPDRNFES
jgi:hypothetical protein